MKTLNHYIILALLITAAVQVQAISVTAQTHTNTTQMNTDKLNNPIVKKAIDAFQAGDKAAWLALFTSDAQLYDDGNKINFKNFSDEALGHEHFVSLDKVEHDGLHVYGKFHSDKWGNFKAYFKFYINPAGQITRLDIGQASY